jgi:S-adenosylmethionine/arginine decarboxylase-like enzyme
MAVQGFTPNHLHLLVRGYLQTPPKEETVLNQWLTELVEKVRMVVVAGPTSVYVDEPGNEGITGTVTLATSHAAIHVWDKEEPAFFQFDIYSCSEFSADEVLDHFAQFVLTSCQWIYIDRNKGLNVVAEGSR